MDIVPPTPAGLKAAADALRRGEIVAYPTETVYGLGVDPFNEAALRRLYTAKGRDPSNPVLLIIGALEQLDDVVAAVSSKARAYADAFWPGPLSILFPASERLPSLVQSAGNRVCVRWTSNPIAAKLCMAFGGAIVSTSANASGDAPARTPQHVPPEAIAVCLDGGALPPSPPSTIVNPETGAILREGAIPRAQLESIAE